MGSGEIVSSMMEVQDTLVKKLGAIECENGNVELQWHSVKKMCARYYDLIRRVDRKASKPWVTQEMINKSDEQRKWNGVQLRKKKGRTAEDRNELKKATDKTKSICDEIMEFQRTGHND
jgi:hypothetical protein